MQWLSTRKGLIHGGNPGLAPDEWTAHLASATAEGTTMIPMPISTATADDYDWGDSCKGWHLVRSLGLSVIEERMAPGTCEERHWHARARQFFYVLSGTLVLEVEGARHELPAGYGIELPQGNAHQARNETNDDVRFLVMSSPPHIGDRREAPVGAHE